MRYDPTGSQVAVGTINGDLKIYNSKTENTGLLNKNLVKPGENAHPISIIRWNPITTYYKYTNQNLITTVQSDGLIQNWFPNNPDPISRIDTH